MEAVVLAAGIGARLLPLTTTIPKALLPIANRSLLDCVISSIKQASIKRIVVVTGHLGSEITKYLQTAKKYGNIEIDSVHAPNYNDGPLYSLLASENLVNDDFFLTPVDLILKHQIISKLVQSHTQSGTVGIAISGLDTQLYPGTYVVRCKRPGSNLGPILQFLEPETIEQKMTPPKTILGTAVGAIVCPIELFKYGHIVARDGFSKVIDALNRYIADGRKARYIKVRRVDWSDVDTIRTLLQANNLILRNSMVDEETGRFYALSTESRLGNKTTSSHDSVPRVIGPTIIGKHCSIGKNSSIGPYVSIQDNCTIGRHVTCSNTIVLSGSKIGDNSEIENAVVRGQEMITAAEPDHEISSSSARI